jgi:hypothetical protein
MSTRPRAARTTVDPSTFDVDGWISKFKPPVVRVPLFARADLIPRIVELQAAADQAAPKDGAETSFADGADHVAIVDECNALIEDLEASAEWFEFGPGTKPKMDAAKAAADADGIAEDDVESRAIYEMAATLISPPIPGAALVALRDVVGDPAFNTLYTGWQEALTLSKSVGPDFLHKRSPTPVTGE